MASIYEFTNLSHENIARRIEKSNYEWKRWVKKNLFKRNVTEPTLHYASAGSALCLGSIL